MSSRSQTSLSLMRSLLYFLVLASPALRVLACARYRSYGEPCIGFEQEMCDTRRMLKCDILTGTCQCPNFYYYFWDSYQARCYHKIGTACQESFGGVNEAWYEHGCPDNSFCNPGTGYCQCKPLFKSNYEGTGCYNSALRVSAAISPILLGSVHFLYFYY